ncbi:cytochrome c biogenesis CcdA family protein [Calorimonas adulescens]|jgi:Cytochrome C biogenesis protein transmembrane region.|nr:cytochrome c biogenesis CcdA family protein [Calorimonas adulescens]
MREVSVIASFTAGLFSFFSPCIVPLLPGYVSYVACGEKKRRLWGLVSFVLGFSMVFVLFGASATLIGGFLRGNMFLFRKIGGAVVILFGIYQTGLVQSYFLSREYKAFKPGENTGLVSSFLLGISFAAGWTPCMSPILGSILVYAGMSDTAWTGMWLLGIYSLGLAMPFISLGLAVDRFFEFSKSINRYLPYIKITGGVILIIFGTLIYTGLITRVSSYFL